MFGSEVVELLLPASLLLKSGRCRVNMHRIPKYFRQLYFATVGLLEIFPATASWTKDRTKSMLMA
jgi:transposase